MEAECGWATFTTPAQKKFFITTTDYFAKWVETEACVNVEDTDVRTS